MIASTRELIQRLDDEIAHGGFWGLAADDLIPRD
jgi:hypothetical protein